MVKRLIFAVLVIFTMDFGFTGKVYAQDPEFTQFYANPLYLNPAFAGAARCPRFVLNYRNQWPGITGSFITYSASYDQHVDALSGGIGMLVTHDEAGYANIIATSTFAGMYAYQLNVTRQFTFKAGFQVMYHQKSVDWSKLNFGDMIDPRRGFVWNTQEVEQLSRRSNIDLSAGLLGFTKFYYAGFAVHHLTEPDEALHTGPAKLPMKFTGHAGAVIPMGYSGGGPRRVLENSISPNIMFQKQQDFTQLLLGMYVNKGPIVGGLWYRGALDAFIALIGFQQGVFKAGYSYDVTVSKLSNQTAGAHELSMTLQFECRPKKKKFRTISCPSF